MNEHSAQGGLIAAAGLLAGLGLVMIQSATSHLPVAASGPSLFWKHALALTVGALLAFGIAHLPLSLWQRVALPFWGLSVILLVATLAVGVEVNGAQRWLVLPGTGTRFQPGEIAKLTTLLAAAAWLSRPKAPRPNSPRELCAPAALALVPAGLLLAQPDFGNAVVLVALVAGLLWIAGTSLRAFVVPGVIGSLGVVGYLVMKPYALQRWIGFLDPWATARNEGFQLVQSFIAFGQGGFFGVGLGDGRQKLFYLPEVHTDFILSLVAEELGLVGVLAVLGLFAALLVFGIGIARRADTRFELLVAFGTTALLTVSAALNAAVVMGLLPTKGLPLPLVSYGRTSLLVSFAAIGLLFAVARRAEASPARRRGIHRERRRRG